MDETPQQSAPATFLRIGVVPTVILCVIVAVFAWQIINAVIIQIKYPAWQRAVLDALPRGARIISVVDTPTSVHRAIYVETRSERSPCLDVVNADECRLIRTTDKGTNIYRIDWR
jgi:hypothetical protein